MDLILASIGVITVLGIIKSNKEKFEETYFESESYYRQNANNNELMKINSFSPAEGDGKTIRTGYNNQYETSPTNPYDSEYSNFYLVSNEQMLNQTQEEWISKNSLYNKDIINGIPIKDYYEKYTASVLEKGNWFLNKDMPEETKQYVDDGSIQQRMEIYTGARQRKEREAIGKPNRTEVNNLFTPQEHTTGFGYQYGQGGGGGPGLALTRQKELEDYKSSIKYKTNEQPFEKIQVGKGIALSPEVPAAGGFQQYARIVPDNISDYKANQLPGMVAGGKWIYSNAPTSKQPVIKQKPNSYYSLCQRGPVAGKSIMTAELMRPDYAVNLKNQNREVINYGFGIPLDSFLCAN
jgi:hypothetical protein